MPLTSHVTHPARRHYVLKLDRDAAPSRGTLSGRIENLATGRHFDFATLDELVSGLAQELADAQGPSSDTLER